jgi:hypothetical protein
MRKDERSSQTELNVSKQMSCAISDSAFCFCFFVHSLDPISGYIPLLFSALLLHVPHDHASAVVRYQDALPSVRHSRLIITLARIGRFRLLSVLLITAKMIIVMINAPSLSFSVSNIGNGTFDSDGGFKIVCHSDQPIFSVCRYRRSIAGGCAPLLSDSRLLRSCAHTPLSLTLAQPTASSRSSSTLRALLLHIHFQSVVFFPFFFAFFFSSSSSLFSLSPSLSPSLSDDCPALNR